MAAGLVVACRCFSLIMKMLLLWSQLCAKDLSVCREWRTVKVGPKEVKSARKCAYRTSYKPFLGSSFHSWQFNYRQSVKKRICRRLTRAPTNKLREVCQVKLSGLWRTGLKVRGEAVWPGKPGLFLVCALAALGRRRLAGEYNLPTTFSKWSFRAVMEVRLKLLFRED